MSQIRQTARSGVSGWMCRFDMGQRDRLASAAGNGAGCDGERELSADKRESNCV